MALVDTHCWMPPIIEFDTTVVTLNDTNVIDSTSDRIALVFKAPTTGSIDRVVFRTGTVTAAETIAVRVERVSLSTGAPDGNLWATDTSGSQSSPSSNTVYEVTLTAAASVTAGDVISVVFQCDSGTPNLIIKSTDSVVASRGSGFPYASRNLTGSYTPTTIKPLLAVRYGATTGYVVIGTSVFFVDSVTTAAVNTGTGATTGTRRGARFQYPFGVQLSGAHMHLDVDGDFDVELYNDAGTLLATLSGQAYPDNTVRIDNSQTNGWTGIRSGHIMWAPQTLTANTWYRLVITPQSASSVTLAEMVCEATVGQATLPMGANFHTTAYIDSAWVDTTTQRPFWALWVTGIEIPASSGGRPAFGDRTGGKS